MRSHLFVKRLLPLGQAWPAGVAAIVLALSFSIASGWEGQSPPQKPAVELPPTVPVPPAPGTTAEPPAPEKKTDAAASDALVKGQFEARFVDSSALKLVVREEKVELVTPYGKLLIPLADITRIELGIRVPADLVKRIDALIAQLGHEDFNEREAASAELAKLGDRAAPALRKALASDSPEMARRAKELLAKLSEREEEDADTESADGPRPEHDVIHTINSTIAGRITAASLKVTTSQFGEVELKLSDVRELRGPGVAQEDEDSEVINDPGTMYQFAAHVGKVMRVRVTGATQQTGGLYGTDYYTGDSNVATAAVHAGVVKPGQTKVVKVKILGPQTSFTGSVKNGFSSSTYGGYGTSYKFVK